MFRLMLDGYIRGYIISGAELVEEARRIHSLSRVCTAALGRQLLMTAIMAAELKHETETLTTILRGGGPTGNLVCTGRYGALVKGYVAHPEVELPLTEEGKLDVGSAVGADGRLSVVKDLHLGEPYMGECAMVSGEVAEDFAQYFTMSEQKPSLVYLGVRVAPGDGRVRAAGGLLLQPLPDCPDGILDTLQEKTARIAEITRRLDEGEALEEIAKHLFGGMELELLDAPAPAYSCDCSRTRMERALIALGREELTDMIREDGRAELTCHFCNAAYAFTGAQLKELLLQATQ